MLHSDANGGEGTPKAKPSSGRKRAAGAPADGETPSKKGKNVKGKVGKASTEGDDEDETKEEIKLEEGSEDELA